MVYDKARGLFLPESTDKQNVLALNWSITGFCMNNCLYCYGKDISALRFLEESERIALIRNIVSLQPDLIIITGGEPLSCEYFRTTVEDFGDSGLNVIVDTSGVINLQDYIQLFRRYNVHVRISLDSSDSRINEGIRHSPITNSTQVVKDNISLLISKDVPLTIQSTITSSNIEHIVDLGEYLQQEGVKNWRLSVVIPHDDVLLDQSMRVFKIVVSLFPNMYIRISNTSVESGNGILLVDPIGNLILRGSKNNEKARICNLLFSPRSKDYIIGLVDYKSHISRYTG